MSRLLGRAAHVGGEGLSLRIGVVVLLGILPLMVGAWTAEAGALDSARPQRRGGIVGGVLGRGSGSFDLSRNGDSRSSGWGSGGTVVRGRVGWAITEELVILGEYGVWRRPESASDSSGTASTSSLGTVDRYLGSGLVSVNLYPHLGGFLLRAGVGYGQTSATIVDSTGSALSASGKGPIIVLGVGYEHFFAHDMSVVFGVDAGRVDGGAEISGNTLQYTIAFQAYFPRGFLHELF